MPRPAPRPERAPAPTPRSTYRLSLRAGVTFDRARALVPYLRRLGIDALYLSPIFRAREGSTHGYDVIDPNQIDPAVGTETSLRSLREELTRYDMKLIVDIVPNHMAQSLEDPWWVDLLAHGPDGPAGDVFDVDWRSGKVLVPVLGEPYGVALAQGLLRAEGDALVYRDLRFPLAEGTAGTRDVDELHAKQHYRLMWWRLANSAINYRRFFDINDLVCVRVEDEQVLGRTHELLDKLIRDDVIDGVRVDHVDGLADPGGYLRHLAERYPGRAIWVEKILGEGERLPETWPVAGTTGYEFITTAEGLFHDPQGLAAMQESWACSTGDDRSFEQIVADAKRSVVEQLFGAEVEALTRAVSERAGEDLLARDIPRGDLRAAIVDSVVALPVYRTYGEVRAPGDGYAEVFVRRCLEQDDALRTRWEQLTGPAMAKGFEDTALYRYTACISRNEVGGEPGAQPADVAAFHRFAKARPPGSLNAGSTHDTKRSEDVRARIAVLTEQPELWEASLGRLERIGERHGEIDPAMEWFFSQSVVGTWEGATVRRRYVDRIADTMLKAAREAKTFTSWLDPDEPAEARMLRWVRRMLRDADAVREFDRLAGAIAWPGAVNSLAALVLRICSPGIPDVYNGAELWHRRLVDPDNRAPVDFARHTKTLSSLGSATQVLRTWESGAIKMFVLQRALAARPEGSYIPLEVTGPLRENVVAFARRSGRSWTVAVVPRLIARHVKPGRMPDWRSTAIALPVGAPSTWTNVFTDEQVRARRVADLLGRFPVAVLTGTGTSGRGNRRASVRR